MKKIAFLFPGQGSQSVGMGQEFYEAYPAAREIFEMASEVTGFNLPKLCFEGPIEELTKTVCLQPAMTAVNLACFAVLNEAGASFDYTAGHSLGEYSALCAAGVISEQTAVELVFKRGQLMHREAKQHEGAMHAIIGLSIDQVEEQVGGVAKSKGPDTQAVVSVANHNMDNQVVVTGTPDLVARVSELAVSAGAKSRPLKVSGAWHSPLMRPAEIEFAEFLADFPFSPARIPVVLNVTASPASEPEEIKAVMAAQLCSKVKWYDAMRLLMDLQVDFFVEVGPGKVLGNMVKKIWGKERSCEIYNINNIKTLEAFQAHI